MSDISIQFELKLAQIGTGLPGGAVKRLQIKVGN